MINNDSLHKYCLTLHTALAEQAVDGVWSGHITRLYGALGISSSHYGTIMEALYQTGSLEQLQRGTRSTLTRIRVREAPDAVKLARIFISGSPLTKLHPLDKLSQRVTNLEGRLQGIDIAQYVAHTEKRLALLEAAVQKES